MRLFLCSIALGALAGCSDDEGSPLPCDITLRSCQQHVYEQTARLRAQSARDLPPVRVIDLAQAEEEFGAAQPEESDAERIWNRALRLAGLLEPETDMGDLVISEFLSEVAAYYDPRVQGITILDRGGDTDPVDDVFVLSHEFVHALQDKEPGLAGFYERFVESTDSSLAADALVEGEASVLGVALVAPLYGIRPQSVDFDAYGQDLIESALESVGEASSPFISAMLTLPYGLGAPIVGQLWQTEGAAAVRRLYERPPPTTRDWLEAFLPDPLQCYPTAAPDGYAGFDHDQLGVVGVLSFLVAAGVGVEDAWGAVQNWRGDRWVLFTPSEMDSEPQVAVAWQIRWSDEDTAERFADRARSEFNESDVLVDGLEVLVRLSDAEVAWPEPACGDEADLPVLEVEAGEESGANAVLRRRLPHRAPRIDR